MSVPTGRWPLTSLLVLATGTFAIACIQMGTSGLVSDIARGLGASEGAIAVSVTAFSLSVAISTIPMFVLLRRRSRKSVLVIAFTTAGAACVAAGLSADVGWFTASRTVGGVAHALFSMASMAYIALTVAPRHRGRSLALAGSGSALAVWLGIPLLTWVGTSGEAGWRVAFLALGLTTLLVSALVQLRLPADPVPDAARSRAADRAWWRVQERSRHRGDVAVVARANAASVANAAAYYVVFSYIGIWLRDVAHVTGQEIATLLLVSGTGAVVGMAAAGAVADLWGTKEAQTCLSSAMVVEAVALVAVGTAGGNDAVLAGAMFLLGIPGGAVAVAQQARVADLTPAALQPATAAGQTIAGNGGMAIAGMLGGVLVATGWSAMLPWATIALAVLALTLDRVMAARLGAIAVAR